MEGRKRFAHDMAAAPPAKRASAGDAAGDGDGEGFTLYHPASIFPRVRR